MHLSRYFYNVSYITRRRTLIFQNISLVFRNIIWYFSKAKGMYFAYYLHTIAARCMRRTVERWEINCTFCSECFVVRFHCAFTRLREKEHVSASCTYETSYESLLATKGEDIVKGMNGGKERVEDGERWYNDSIKYIIEYGATAKRTMMSMGIGHDNVQ